MGTADGDPGPGAEPPVLVPQHVAPLRGDLLRVQFEGVADRTAAERLAHRYLLLPGDEIDPPGEGEAFLHELLGMQVELENGEPVGEVLDLFDMPHGVLIDVAWKGGRVTLPLHEDFVRDIRRDERRIVMALPEGLLD